MEEPRDEGLSSSVLLAKVLERLDHLTLEVAHLTQHTVPCTTKDGDQCYKCAHHPKYPWPDDLCPDHAKRIGKPHRDLHLANVKEHATLSAGASVDHGVEVETTKDHVNRAADRGCCVSSCSVSWILSEALKTVPR